MFAEPEVLFGNLDELCTVTYAFCEEFLNILIEQLRKYNTVKVVSILDRLYLQNNQTSSSNQAHHQYSLNYINALQYLENLRGRMEFVKFEKWCNKDPRCKKLQLTDLLVTPVQHLMRVPLLLKAIESKTIDLVEKRMINVIIKQQERSIRDLDDKMQWLKNFERLLEIQWNIIWPSILTLESKLFYPEVLKSYLSKQPCEKIIVCPRRQVVLEGPLLLIDFGKLIEMYVFLFNDMLLITRRKKIFNKKQSTLSERLVNSCGGRSSSFASVITGSSVGSFGPGRSSSSTLSKAAVSISGSGSATSSSLSNTSANWSSSHMLMKTEPNRTKSNLGLGKTNYKYIVYKQPLSLDRFQIYDVPFCGGLKNSFTLVCLNCFNQIINVHSFQAPTEILKHVWLEKLKTTCERWQHLIDQETIPESSAREPLGGSNPGVSNTKHFQNHRKLPINHLIQRDCAQKSASFKFCQAENP
ncbi:RhoGEF-like protein [Sarcoptes scabiei]|uniref:RhoGEF-like protein n=1 Tax=Sarcoptes scabiei TaxID=52283 RepID=A0A132AH32_SARSC|nr:RhoGEF-like protein [Sarcoptes scabiei]